jgi:hypothetical protein
MVNSIRFKCGVMSNTLWQDFHFTACERLEVNHATAKLAYRVCNDGYYDGKLTKIDSEGEWSMAVSAVCSAMEADDAVDLELMDVANVVSDRP